MGLTPHRFALQNAPHPALRATCLAAARSRRGSDMPPACHSLPRRRFATPGGRQGCVSLRRTVHRCPRPPLLRSKGTGERIAASACRPPRNDKTCLLVPSMKRRSVTNPVIARPVRKLAAAIRNPRPIPVPRPLSLVPAAAVWLPLGEAGRRRRRLTDEGAPVPRPRRSG